MTSKRVMLAALGAANLGNAFVLPGLFQEAFDVNPSMMLEEHFGQANSWGPHIPYFLKPMIDTEKLQESIKIEDLNATAWDLYHIAEHSKKEYGNPTRVIGSKGHNKTLEYILQEFDNMKDYYEVSLQHFDALTGKVKSFNLSDPVSGKNFQNASALNLSPPVEPFVGELIEIPNLGCHDSDYASVSAKSHLKNGKSSKSPTPKKIALIERGMCSFGEKSELAGKHGYHAVVIYDNEPDSDSLKGTLGTPTKHSVSAIGVPHHVGKDMISSISKNSHYSIFFSMDSFVKIIKTTNIIADTKHGDEDNIVGLGAHSDSVEDGPGINDDGSGTISLLTVAKQLTHFKINNKVRFAWWAAEEEGLLGSNYYAYNLTMDENHKMRLFMDYDMMASPNYEYEIYDANNVDHPKGSEELKNLYIEFYKSKNLNYTLIPFDGRSDYVGFIENGIPAGGIATGAEKKNVFNGGILDVCYHQLCDDVSNLSWEAFLTNTQLIAHSVATYAKSLEDFPERSNATVQAAVKSKGDTAPMFKYRADYLII